MSAYKEYVQEKQAIDVLLVQGYAIVGIKDGLDGTDVRFERGVSVKERMRIRLLNADARKYVARI